MGGKKKEKKKKIQNMFRFAIIESTDDERATALLGTLYFVAI